MTRQAAPQSEYASATPVSPRRSSGKVHGRRASLLLGSLVCLLAFPALATAEPRFSDPDIPDGQTLHYRFKTGEYASDYLIDVKKREEVVQSTHRSQVEFNEKGEKIYRVEDWGSRRNGQRFRNISEILAAGKEGMEPLGFQARETTREGKVIRRFEASFDDPSLTYPENTFPVLSILHFMRGIDFQEKGAFPFYLWVTPTEIYRMHFDVIGKETIKVPAGEIPCYLGELKPDIRTIMPIGRFLASLLSPFIPKYRFWFACEESHPLVKFEGVLGGSGAASHTIELTKIEYTAKVEKEEPKQDVQEGAEEESQGTPPEM